MDIDYRLIGQRIKAARGVRGWTCAQLAEQAGLATPSMAHIESATNQPSLKSLFRIAEVLGVTLDYLTGRTGNPTEQYLLEKKDLSSLSAAQESYLADIVDGLIPYVKRMK